MADRERQREHRAKKLLAAQEKKEPVSQASLSPQLSVLIEQTVTKVEHEKRLSQTSLRRCLCLFAQKIRREIEFIAARTGT
jgi:hypothetical protein